MNLHRIVRHGILLTLLTFLCHVSIEAGEIEIIHIRLGQGDGTLILGPKGTGGKRVSILIDAGGIPAMGRDAGKIVGAVLHKNKVKELDFFIATHYDADHIGGIIAGESHIHGHAFVFGPNNVPGAVGDDDGDGKTDWLDSSLTRMRPDPEEVGKDDDVRIANFVDRGDAGAPTSQTYKKYLELTKVMGIRKSLTKQNDVNTFEIDLGDGAKMTCLSANGFVRDRASKVSKVNTENEKSLCFLLTYKGFDYLNGGDTIGRSHGQENAKVEKAIGQYIAANNIEVDMLHVNHHGANNGSDSEFLDMIKPEIAVISLGNDNSHHHPNVHALERLVASGVYRIYQTSWGTTTGTMPEEVRRRQAIFQQDVIVTTDGTSYEVSTRRRFNVDN